jgi:hypothetical protein
MLFVVFNIVGLVERWKRCVKVDLVGIHPHLAGPCTFVVRKALHCRTVGEVVQACLHGLRAFFSKSAGGLYGGANDCDVAGDVGVRVDEDQHDEIALIGQMLRFQRGTYRSPTVVATSFAIEPTPLSACKEVRTVLRGTQHINSEALPSCGGECTAMGVTVAVTGFPCTPMHLGIGKPQVFDIHALQNLQHVLTGRGNGAAAADFGWRCWSGYG